ncbi:MAG: flagellum-specific ATP synthase FliI [Sneathiella sp.]|nr:MAG: flagellum-specific ATP synthase FliI [Sneathiella sp.]
MQSIISEISRLSSSQYYGRVAAIQGLLVEIGGIQTQLSIGSRVNILARGGGYVRCEAVGFKNDRTLLMPFGALEGIGIGCKAEVAEQEPVIRPDVSWLGRVVNAMGEPIDGGPPLKQGKISIPYRNTPPPAHTRQRVAGKIDLGVRSLNSFVSCCRGQRMGIFAGSGVGKSVLFSMLARNTEADVNVIGLIGERGREVQEFIEDDLGEEGLKRSVVVVATSDESALMRRQAAYLTLALAEYFRDLENDVLCLMDSVTRFAMAQRDIGLSGGEPPASKGYTPTVFSELPKLLERAGPGAGKGTITGLFTVLVEGDDHNEPIADAVRGILDGHIVMERQIAERGRYPAVNVLKSISRTMPGCNTAEENQIISKARKYLSIYDDMAEMIRLGAYRPGTDPAVDEAMHFYPLIEKFMTQNKQEKTSLADCYQQLADILSTEPEMAAV